MRYNRFRVIVEDKSNRRIIKQSDASLHGRVREDNIAENALNQYSEMLATGKLAERDYLVTLGSLLYERLFDKTDTPFSQAFKGQFDKVQREDQAVVLRLILEFEKDARSLAEMPWEYIYYPDDDEGRGFFLAAHSKLILARYVPLNEDTLEKLKTEKGPLRILVAVAKPDDLGPVKAEPVIETIEALKNAFPDLIETHLINQPTKRSLTEKIDDTNPHVLHFIGHGQLEPTSGGSIALLRERDQKESLRKNQKSYVWISDTDLADCFMNHQPRLNFLQVCEGARPASFSHQAFRGLALQLVYSGIPAVVALQYKVENEVANLFAKTFYQSLGKGKPVDAAVQDGRRELGIYLNEKENFSSRAFGSPVVFLQTPESIIIPVTQRELANTQDSLTASVTLECPRCREELPSNLKLNYCFHCGTAVMNCPKCNRLIDWNGDCTWCGYRTSLGNRVKSVPLQNSDPSDHVNLG